MEGGEWGEVRVRGVGLGWGVGMCTIGGGCLDRW